MAVGRHKDSMQPSWNQPELVEARRLQKIMQSQSGQKETSANTVVFSIWIRNYCRSSLMHLAQYNAELSGVRPLGYYVNQRLIPFSLSHSFEALLTCQI